MNALQTVEQLLAIRLTIALIHFLWQGTLLAVAAALAARLLRSATANARHAIHVTALALMAACVPLTLAWVQPEPLAQVDGRRSVAGDQRVAASVARPVSGAQVAHRSTTPGLSFPDSEDSRGGQATRNFPRRTGEPSGRGTDPMTAAAPTAMPRLADAGRTVLRRSAPYVAFAYLAGVAVLLVRLARGTLGSRRLQRSGEVIQDPELLRWLHAQTQNLGIRLVPVVRWCSEISVPAVMGILRPIVLVPASAATGLSTSQLQAVIAHELAHVRRYDLVVNLLQRIVESLLFFHPGVWWVSRQISLERELACDDLVVSSGFERIRYADALVKMAEVSSLRGRSDAAWLATGLAFDGGPAGSPDEAGTELRRRVLRILRQRQSVDIRPGRLDLCFAASLAVVGLLLPAVWIHRGEAVRLRAADVPGLVEPLAAAQELDPPAAPQDPEPRPAAENRQEDDRLVIRGNSLHLLYSPDGRRLAVANGNPTRTLYQDRRSVAENWSPTVHLVESASVDATRHNVMKLDLTRLPSDPNRPADQGPTFVEVTALAFSPDGSSLAVGSSIGQVLLFDCETGTLVRSLDDPKGRLADEETPEYWKQMPRVMGSVSSLAFSPDGKSLAVCGGSFAAWRDSLDSRALGGLGEQEATLKVLDVESGELKFHPQAHLDMAVDVDYSPDGRYLALAGRWMDAGYGNGVILWDASTGERKARLDLEIRGWMYDIQFSPDSRYVLAGAQQFDSGGGNGTGIVALLSADTLAVSWRRSVTRSAMSVAFDPGHSAAISLVNRAELGYLDLATGQTLNMLEVASDESQKQRCEGFAVSPGGNELAVGIVQQGRGQVQFLKMQKLRPGSDVRE